MTTYEIFKVIFDVYDVGQFLDRLREIGDTFAVGIVCLDAGRVAGLQHVKVALEHALRSMDSGNPIAKTFEMEVLLYASGSRQCQDAAEFGLHSGKNKCFLCIAPPNPDALAELRKFMNVVTDDWELIDPPKKERLMKLFSITEEELEAVGQDRLNELVIERVAMLDAYR